MNDFPLFKFEKKYFMLQFFLTDRCQLRCDYCLNYGSTPSVGSYEENVDKIFDKLVADSDFSSEDTVRIVLIGGEPLLEMDRVIYTVNKLNQAPFKPSYHLYTNGILLDEEMIDLLNSLNVAIVISIDSLSFPNSRCKDRDIFDKIISNIKIAAQKTENLSITSVIAKETFRSFPALYEFLKENKIRYWTWNFVQIKDPELSQFSEEEWKELESIITNIVNDKSNFPSLSSLTRYRNEATIDQQELRTGLFFQVGIDKEIRGSGGRQEFHIPIDEFSWEGLYHHYLNHQSLYDNRYIVAASGQKKLECHFCIYRAFCTEKENPPEWTICRYNSLLEQLAEKGEE